MSVLFKRKNFFRSVFVSLSLLSGVSISAFAQDASNTGAQSPASTTPVVKVTIKKVELSLEELRDIGLDLKHVLSASRHLYDEVSIQPVSIATEPEIIDMGVVISIPVAAVPAGPPAPPRKDRVDMLMSEITPVINQLKTNVDDFVSGNKELDLPDDVRQKLKPDLDNWVTIVNNMAEQLQTLQSLTQGPKYDNYAIAQAATAIQDGAKKLDETRKSVYKIMRQEGKSAESANK